ncbi:hypothetical protein, partial [Providencia stuartii]|uniref:hypothetical protein n=1 Tax=Providencia stuartii TaxID=588 RepID=UPI001955CF36
NRSPSAAFFVYSHRKSLSTCLITAILRRAIYLREVVMSNQHLESVISELSAIASVSYIGLNI